MSIGVASVSMSTDVQRVFASWEAIAVCEASKDSSAAAADGAEVIQDSPEKDTAICLDVSFMHEATRCVVMMFELMCADMVAILVRQAQCSSSLLQGMVHYFHAAVYKFDHKRNTI